MPTMDSNTECPKSHVDDSSTFLPNLANFAGSDGLRFLQNWWIGGPTLQRRLLSVVTRCLFAYPQAPSLGEVLSKLAFLK